MSERRDETPESAPPTSAPEREGTPRSYYYDDGTGYEVYDPDRDEEDTGQDDDEDKVKG